MHFKGLVCGVFLWRWTSALSACVSHVRKTEYLWESHMRCIYFFFISMIRPYKICLPCQTALNWVTSTSTMRQFTELLLLVAGMFPLLLFVNGLQALQPAIKNHSLRRDAMIGGLLVPRGFFCPSGFICESIFCCPQNWNCCRGLLLSPSPEFKFHRRANIS